jgi:hypothetical protein
MTNDEKSTKPEQGKDDVTIVEGLIIRHSFELRHSDFVIPAGCDWRTRLG